MTHSRFAHAAGILGLLLVLCGCPQSMVPVLIGNQFENFPPPEPDFEKKTGQSLLEDDPIVTIVCWAPLSVQGEHPGIHNELARELCSQFHSNQVRVTNPDLIEDWSNEHPQRDFAEIGCAFEADYVIDIEVAGFSLYEENSDELLRGRTEAYVTVVEMLPDGTGKCIYETEIDFAFPTKFPRSAGDNPYSQFKMEYLTALSEKIAWLFVPRETGAMMHWAT